MVGMAVRLLACASMVTEFAPAHTGALSFYGYIYNDPPLLGTTFSGPFWNSDEEDWDIDRSFLQFDTSTLGASAKARSASLSLAIADNTYQLLGTSIWFKASTWTYPIDYSQWGALGATQSTVTVPLSAVGTRFTAAILPATIAPAGTTKLALQSAEESTTVDLDVGWDATTAKLRVRWRR